MNKNILKYAEKYNLSSSMVSTLLKNKVKFQREKKSKVTENT